MAAAIGFSFSFHYCGGSFHGICFTSDTEKGCCGSKEKSNGCCEDKVVSAKYKDDHTPASFAVLLKTVPAIISPQYHYGAERPVIAASYPVTNYNKGPSPPLLKGVPLYILICSFRV